MRLRPRVALEFVHLVGDAIIEETRHVAVDEFERRKPPDAAGVRLLQSAVHPLARVGQRCALPQAPINSERRTLSNS